MIVHTIARYAIKSRALNPYCLVDYPTGFCSLTSFNPRSSSCGDLTLIRAPPRIASRRKKKADKTADERVEKPRVSAANGVRLIRLGHSS